MTPWRQSAPARSSWPPSTRSSKAAPGRTRPSAYGCCSRLGLPSPRHFLAAARVLYAHRLLQDPGFTIEDVAQRLGYAQTKTLQLHARAYLGLTAGEMRLTLEPRQALERIAQGFAPLRQT